MEPWYGAAMRWVKHSARSVNGTCARAARLLVPDLVWLYPKGYNHRHLPGVIEAVLHSGREHAEFMMHSSELMPGGSPNFPTGRSIERLYETIEGLFEGVRDRFVPVTMWEFHERVRREKACAACAVDERDAAVAEKAVDVSEALAVASKARAAEPVAS
jgi:hypothetical protein